jgi:protein TonB
MAQVPKKAYNDKQNMEVVLEREPAFPKGESALYKYFYDSLNFTQEAINFKIDGEVMASFDVLPDSSLSNVLIISGLGYGIDEEFIRLLKQLRYSPSIQNGVPLKANVIITLPVRARKK